MIQIKRRKYKSIKTNIHLHMSKAKTIKEEVKKRYTVVKKQLKAIELLDSQDFKTPCALDEIPIPSGFIRVYVNRSNSINELIATHAHLKALKNNWESSAKELGVQLIHGFKVKGCSFEDWEHDIMLRIKQIQAKELEVKLKRFEAELSEHIPTEDKLTELFKEMDNNETLLLD